MRKTNRLKAITCLIIGSLLLIVWPVGRTRADEIDQLKQKVDEQDQTLKNMSARIGELEKVREQTAAAKPEDSVRALRSTRFSNLHSVDAEARGN
jgi:hypothetical protein